MVIMRHAASGLSCISPVISPTSLNVCLKSRNFWLDSALIGEVYTVLRDKNGHSVFIRNQFSLHIDLVKSLAANNDS